MSTPLITRKKIMNEDNTYLEKEREKHDEKNINFIILLLCISIHTTLVNTRKRGYYFLSSHILQYSSLPSHLKANAWGDGFFNGSFGSFLRKNTLSLFSIVAVCYFLSKEEYMGLGAWHAKNEGRKGVRAFNALNSHLVSFFLSFLFNTFCVTFSYI